jgi:hypothetical protein
VVDGKHSAACICSQVIHTWQSVGAPAQSPLRADVRPRHREYLCSFSFSMWVGKKLADLLLAAPRA